MCHRVITVLSLVAVTHGFSSLPQASPSPTPMQMPGPPPPLPAPSSPPRFQCQDFSTEANTIFAMGDCTAIGAFCTGNYGPLVKGLCPVTCGACADYCTDQDPMMALWATQNTAWPTACINATAADKTDAIYKLACGASSSKCLNAPPAAPPPPPPPAPSAPPSSVCQDYSTFAASYLGGGCTAIASYCTGSFGPLVKGMCPVTCGVCADYCTDQDPMMALWATQNTAWPTTCAAATTAAQQADGIYILACGASGSKCSAAATPSPSPSPSPTCADTDNGATDVDGYGCAAYTAIEYCGGQYDNANFFSDTMCCVCGGGVQL